MKVLPIEGFPYTISVDGAVTNARTGKVLRPHIGKDGYPRVTLCVDYIRTRHTVHSLVLRAFRGEPGAGQEACHNNGIRADCRLENLRWDTRSANAYDRYAHGYSASEATRAAISASNKGRQVSNETREKMASAKRGTKRGPMPKTTKERISQGNRRAWARRKGNK